MILEVRDVCAGYGTAPVLRNISFTQLHGEVLALSVTTEWANDPAADYCRAPADGIRRN